MDLVLDEVLCRTVRSSAAVALGKLSALSTRIDSLVGDLLSGLQVYSYILFVPAYSVEALELNQLIVAYQASDVAVREAILTALEGVIKNAGKGLSSAVIARLLAQLKDMIYGEDDQIRSSAASILGILLKVNGNNPWIVIFNY